MALPAAALPAPPNMLGANDDAKQEYFEALQKTLTALDARANQGPNWFQLAGALLDPGRTGNVGEALGRASTVLGSQQERQADMQLPIAQMRAQLAGQKYETENQSKALALLSQTLGVPPEKAIQQLSAGSIAPSDMSKLAQVYPIIAQLSPKVGDIVKGVFGMQKDIGTMDLENRKFLGQSAQADRTAGMTQADLVAKYGSGVLSLIPGGGMPTPGPAAAAAVPMTTPGPAAVPMTTPGPAAGPMPTPGPAAGPMPTPGPAAGPTPGPAAVPMTTPGPAAGPMPATNNPEVLPILAQVKDLRQMLASTQDPTLQVNAKDALQKLEADLKTRFGISMPPMPAQSAPPVAAAPAVPMAPTARPVVPADLQNLPLAAQSEVAKKRIEESDKPYNTKRDEILAYTPQLLESSNTNLRQLDQIARQKPQIFALMQKQGLMSGLLTLAEQGAQLTAGTFNARLGLPVQQFLEKVKLSEPDQQSVRDVSRILGAEFLSNVKANKGLLGVNPTDNDSRLLQAPMVNVQDSAKAVQLWSRQQILLNKQRESMYNALSAYGDSAGATASPRQFFSPGSVYDKINKDYSRFRMQLFRQFYPTE